MKTLRSINRRLSADGGTATVGVRRVLDCELLAALASLPFNLAVCIDAEAALHAALWRVKRSWSLSSQEIYQLNSNALEALSIANEGAI